MIKLNPKNEAIVLEDVRPGGLPTCENNTVYLNVNTNDLGKKWSLKQSLCGILGAKLLSDRWKKGY